MTVKDLEARVRADYPVLPTSFSGVMGAARRLGLIQVRGRDVALTMTGLAAWCMTSEGGRAISAL
jgi:hypothetical protein